ncbi:hypothetical protein OH799_35325 [Nocardia sp. NBC_00881]|uniref:hypothetical protein n=1 Tax=Nocardia sp. NBC_00881 TaxID=2975995 RepID=UPI00386F1F05|nr:hypothetical protein OH799_35325 [Nocardia sp. NBC_00881]
MSSGFVQGGWESFMKKALPIHRIAISDDKTPFNDEDIPFAPGGGHIIELPQGPVARENEPMVMSVTGSCERDAFSQLDGIYRIGAMGPEKEMLLTSPLFGPVQVGGGVGRFEVKLGMRNINSTGPRTHFPA